MIRSSSASILALARLCARLAGCGRADPAGTTAPGLRLSDGRALVDMGAHPADSRHGGMTPVEVIRIGLMMISRLTEHGTPPTLPGVAPRIPGHGRSGPEPDSSVFVYQTPVSTGGLPDRARGRGSFQPRRTVYPGLLSLRPASPQQGANS